MNVLHKKFLTGVLSLLTRWGLICTLLLPVLAYSHDQVLIVASSNGTIYQDFISEIKENLDKNITVTKIVVSELNDQVIKGNRIIIPVGFKAAASVAKYKISENIIYALIPDNVSLIRKLPCDKNTCHKIYINQPVNRYVKLFKIMFPQDKRLVFATTVKNSNVLRQLEIAANHYGVEFKKIFVKKDQNITRTFINRLKHNDVLLALPDPYIYNKNTAKSVILTSYHANVPIIAYSKSFAKAGALVSLYSGIDNVAKKTAVVVNAVSSHEFLNKNEYYPDDFMIEINSSVARSLDIDVDSGNVIKSKIK